jgi:predicted nucleic acid-binding protein
MTLVVDASVAIGWFVELARSDRAETILQSGELLIAPDLIVAEIANTAWKFVNFEGLPVAAAEALVKEVADNYFELVPSAVLRDRALAIALALRHSAYDCFYLALAEQRDAPLVTADDRLLRVCANTPFAKLVRAL